MPELPEVETVRRGLHELIIGRVVKKVVACTAKSFPNAPVDVDQFLIGSTITNVRRRAKVLLIDLSTDYTLVIHLKMTGQLVFVKKEASSVLSGEQSFDAKLSNGLSRTGSTVKGVAEVSSRKSAASQPEQATWSIDQTDGEVRWGAGHPNDSLIGELPDRSTRVTFTFADGSHLYFNDQRKFGWVKLIPTIEVPNIDFMKKVGPEPLESDFTVGQFIERFARKKKSPIKAALLDQTVIAGVGNIYADESLWGAKIHPLTKVADIPSTKYQLLYTELRSILNEAIAKGGSTDRNYVNAEGKKGSYIDFARVFRREGKPCPRCGTIIVKFKAAGRGTHICPECQQLN